MSVDGRLDDIYGGGKVFIRQTHHDVDGTRKNTTYTNAIIKAPSLCALSTRRDTRLWGEVACLKNHFGRPNVRAPCLAWTPLLPVDFFLCDYRGQFSPFVVSPSTLFYAIIIVDFYDDVQEISVYDKSPPI